MKKAINTALVGLRALTYLLIAITFVCLLSVLFSGDTPKYLPVKPPPAVKVDRVTVPTMAVQDGTDLIAKELIDSGAEALRDTASRIP